MLSTVTDDNIQRLMQRYQQRKDSKFSMQRKDSKLESKDLNVLRYTMFLFHSDVLPSAIAF